MANGNEQNAPPTPTNQVQEAEASARQLTRIGQDVNDLSSTIKEQVRVVGEAIGDLKAPELIDRLEKISTSAESAVKQVSALRTAMTGEVKKDDLPAYRKINNIFIIIFSIIIIISVFIVMCLSSTTSGDVSQFILQHAASIIAASVIVGALSPLPTKLATETVLSKALLEAFGDGVLRAGAGLVGALTAVGGAKAIDHYMVGSGPQVVLIGSGTVHRYLFGSAEGALGIPMGRALGPHGVRFWGFEGQSGDGIRFAAYAYAHHGDEVNDDRLPVIGMVSSDLFFTNPDTKTVEWKDKGLCYFTSRMDIVNPNSDDFVVVPLNVDIESNWYVSPSKAADSLLPMGPMCLDAEKKNLLAPFSIGAPYTIYLPGKGTNLDSGSVSSSTTTNESNNKCDDEEYKKGTTTPINLVKNFSLSLPHIEVDDKVTKIAFGNFVEPGKDWRTIPCPGCDKRDLALLIAISGEHDTWTTQENTCHALYHIMSVSNSKIGDYISFSDCNQQKTNDNKCTCTVTDIGKRFLIRNASSSDLKECE
jgi:hypothetical protein